MKKLLLAGLIVLASSSAFAGNKGPFQWPVVAVKDGDTFQVAPDWLPEGLNLSIRVKGVDTPEKAPRALCDKEAELGKKATEYSKARLADGIFYSFIS